MKPVYFGILFGYLLGAIAGVLVFGPLYGLIIATLYFWLPLSVVSVAICAFYYRVRYHTSIVPSLWTIGIVGLTYWGIYFGYPEYLAYTAKSALDHYKLSQVFHNRALFFPDEVRADFHLEQAAIMGMQGAALDVGTSYLYGAGNYPKDKEKAKFWLKLEAAKGGAAGKRAEEEMKDAAID